MLLAAGDIGKCTDVGERGPYLTADLLAMRPEATILALGDLAYSHGTAAEFANCYGPTWGRFKDRTRPVPGNHEYRTADASGYFGYWGPQARPDGHSYYSFDLGDWHLVALDTNLDVSADSAQARWLRSDLAGSAARCKLAFFHHPRFSSGKHGDSPEMERDLQDPLRRPRERRARRARPPLRAVRAAGPVGRGRADTGRALVRGGHRRRAFARARGRPAPGSEARDVGAKGVLQLVLRADGYDWAFLPVDGASYSDSGSGACAPVGEGPGG